MATVDFPDFPAGLSGLPVCYLETVGRVTGKRRTIEIWFAIDGWTAYVLSGGRDAAHWVRNIRAQPSVRVRVGGRTFAGQARVIEGETPEPRARRLLASKYQGWSQDQPLSRWARESLPVAIDLVPRETKPGQT